MNNTFLTPAEIAELKAIRAGKINDKELEELSAFLELNDKKISLSQSDNLDNTWAIIFLYCTKKILGQPEYDLYKDELAKGGDASYVVNHLLESKSPRLFKLLNTARDTNFRSTIELVNDKISEYLEDESGKFNSTEFILNKNFDFSPYTVDKCDSKLIQNTIAINTAVTKFFDSITKELNEEQKTYLVNNFVQILSFHLENTGKTTIKEKDNDFKVLVKHTHKEHGKRKGNKKSEQV